MGDWTAIDDLIRRASDPAASAESLREAIGPVFATFSPDDRAGAEVVLRRLAEEVVNAPTRPDLAGTVAAFCGALVERGLAPTIAIGPILDRIERQIAPDAIAFVAACLQAGRDGPSPRPNEGDALGPAAEPNDPPDPVERQGARIAALMPHEAQSVEACAARGARRAGRPVRPRRIPLGDDAGARRRADRGAAPRGGEGLSGADLRAGRQLPTTHPP